MQKTQEHANHRIYDVPRIAAFHETYFFEGMSKR